jgi:putative colanic acid biosynthesis UDP-glucose lipid carrier transferase
MIRGYMVRHKVTPGITGLAQINGCRGETNKLEDMEKRVHYDLEYLRRWSLTLDFRILLRTLGTLLRDKKAY